MYESRRSGKVIRYIILFAVLISVGVYFFYKNGFTNSVEGIRDPIQESASGSVTIERGEYRFVVHFQYSYDIEALVVHTHDYGSGVDSLLSPKDLALAWGSVAAHNKDVNFNWDQSGRWYSWHVKSWDELDEVGGKMGVITQSANNHIIPAGERVKNDVMAIKKGDHIRLQGYLVNIEGYKNGTKCYYWNSSTTRGDSGDHSCEVFYVTEVEWL